MNAKVPLAPPSSGEHLDRDIQGGRDLRAFVGPNGDAFLNWGTSRWKNRCWAGFFLPIPWFLYRKMYGCAALVVLLPTAIAMVTHWTPLLRATGFGIMTLGLQGRTLYRAHARRTIAVIRSIATDEAEAQTLIARAGGVSVPGAVIGAVITVAIATAPFLTGWVAQRVLQP